MSKFDKDVISELEKGKKDGKALLRSVTQQRNSSTFNSQKEENGQSDFEKESLNKIYDDVEIVEV
jgi:hypothetical protein